MIYQFSTLEAHYPADPPVAEPLDIYWDSESGEVLGFLWAHAAQPRRLHPDRGTLTSDGYIYFALDIRMTDIVNMPIAFLLRGLVSIDFNHLPNGARMAAIEEGSGTAWLAATGTITVASSVPDEALPLPG